MRQEWIGLVADPTLRTTTMVRCQGLLWQQEASAPKTAIVATHFSVDFTEHYLASHMADRGFAFLGWNTRFRGADEFFSIPEALIDIGAAVELLRSRFENVVLLGNSGGGTLMGAYQSIAESPDEVTLARITTNGYLLSKLRHLQRADAYIALNAHPSRARTLTAWLDPAVVSESDPFAMDPDISLWGGRAGKPPFDLEFVLAYRKAQTERNRRITAWVRAQQQQVEAVGGVDRVFSVHRAWADPRFVDLTIDPSDRGVGCLVGADVRQCNYSAYGLARITTLGAWLSMWSLETDALNAATHIGRITVPVLVVQGTADASVFPSDCKELFDCVKAQDRALHWVEGGDHYFKDRPDLVPVCADYLCNWLHEHGF